MAFHGEQEIFSMIKRVLVVSMVGLSLVGCVNNDTLSGMFIPLLKRNKYRMSAMSTIVNVRSGTDSGR